MTMHCLLGLTPEMLSSYHDGALPQAKTDQIRTHIRNCPACRATMAHLADLAHILGSQRIPAPDPLNWSAIQARIERTTNAPSRRSPQTVWRSLGALALVVVLVTLFAQVLGHRSGKSIGIVATSSPTIHPTSTAAPQTITPEQAWGNTFATHVDVSTIGNFFSPEAIFPDGSAVIGTMNCQGLQCIAIWNVNTHATRIIYTAPADLVTPFAVTTDGRFVVWWGGNTGEGAKSAHNILEYTDLQTGHVVKLMETINYTQPSFSQLALDHGTLLWETWSATGSPGPTIMVTNLASADTRSLPMINDNWNFTTFSWPYALWNNWNSSEAIPTAWYLMNLQTDQVEKAPGITASTGVTTDAVLNGTTLFWLPPVDSSDTPMSWQLKMTAPIDQSGDHVQSLGPSFSGIIRSPPVANNRLVAWVTTDSLTTVWDRVQSRMITFNPDQLNNVPVLVISSHALLIYQNGGYGKGSFDIIDTDRLRT